MIIGGSGSGKTNVLLNLIKEQDNIDQIYLFAKDLSKARYEFLIKKREDVGIKCCNDPNAFSECSNRMDDIYQNIDDYNPSRKRKILTVFDDMIADIMTNKKFQVIVKELFIRRKKVNISLLFITRSYFPVPKDVIKFNILFDYEDQQQKRITKNIAINHATDIDYNNFVRIYRECIRKPYSVLTIDPTLPASDPLRFRKNLLPSCKNDSN